MGKRERPILFSGPMIQAILEGNKTVTRRVIKPQTELRPGTMLGPTRQRIETAYWHWKDEWWWQDPQPSMIAKCPYGQVGDLLWVRETWAMFSSSHDFEYGWEGIGLVDVGIPKSKPKGRSLAVVYKADGYYAEEGETWRPSIHMPRWASRLTLEITNVRVERVQDISEQDAVSEGVTFDKERLDPYSIWPAHMRPRSAFRELWDSINSGRGYGWDANPFVWCISFKRI